MLKEQHFRKAWDNWLLILTFLSFLALGLLSLGGTAVSWWRSLVQPGWEKTWLYSDYLISMNTLALPFALSLTILVVLCLPKRLTDKKTLIAWLLLTSFSSLIGLALYGWTVFLAIFFVSSLIASAFTFFLFITLPEKLNFQKEGSLNKLGSLLLHSGYLLFLANLAIFYNSPNHLRLFWVSFPLIITGNLLTLVSMKRESKKEISSYAGGQKA